MLFLEAPQVREEDLERDVEDSDGLLAVSVTSKGSLSQLLQLSEKYAESLAGGKLSSNSSPSEFVELAFTFRDFKLWRK